MNDEIFFDGVRYISASDAAENSGLTRDYVGRLCRDEKVRGRRIGKNWYVDNDSFSTFLIAQEYAKSQRRETLAKERAQEYRTHTPVPIRKEISAYSVSMPSKKNISAAFAIAGVAAPISNVSAAIAQRGNEIRTKLQKALETPSSSVMKTYESLSQVPTGFASAALQSAHVPVYTITPFVEFLHKVVALTLTAVLILGTYAAVDPQYAHFAAQSAHDEAAAAFDSYKGIGLLADRTQSQVAAVAENPQLAASALSGVFTDSLPNFFSDLARTVNTGINDAIYAIAFPANLIRSIGIAGKSDNGSVAVQVLPYQKVVTGNTTTPSTPAQYSGSTTIVNNSQPVIERVVTTERVVTAGGVSEAELNDKLNQLSNKFTSQLYNFTSSGSTLPSSGGITNNIALTQRIDQLDGTRITNATITGGSISGVTLSAGDISGVVPITKGGTGTSSAPTYGQLLLGDGSGGYALVATSSLGITGGGGGSGTPGGADTQVQFNDGGTFGGDSSFTFSSSTKQLGATNAIFVNATTTNATSTNFFSTTASSTNLFSQAASFGSLAVSGASATSTFAGNISVGGNININGVILQNNLPLISSQWITSGSNISYSAGNVGIGTTTPFAKFSLAATSLATTPLLSISTSTASATTTIFAIDSNGNTTIGNNGSLLVVNGATSTFANGINLTTGCFAIGNNCLTLGSFSGTLGIANGGTNATSFTSGQPIAFDGTRFVSTSTLSVAYGGTGATSLTGLLQGNGTSPVTGVTGTAGQFPYYNGTNTLLATSTLFLSTASNVGIGTASPVNKLDILNSPSDTSGNAGFGLLAAPSVGTLTSVQTFTINAATSTFAPTGTFANAASGFLTPTFNASNQSVNLSGITLGNLSHTGARNQVTANGNFVNITGSPVYNDTVGSGTLNRMTVSGFNSSVALTPVFTNTPTQTQFISSAGTFGESSSLTLPSGSPTTYGLNVSNTSNLFSPSSGTAYGGFFSNGAIASSTYGLYVQTFTSAVGNAGYGLYIQGPGTTNANDYSLYSGGTAPSYFAGNLGVGTTTPWGKLALSTAAQQDGILPLFNIASTTNTSLFTVLGNGNTGIGTQSPTSPLHIVTSLSGDADSTGFGLLSTPSLGTLTTLGTRNLNAASSTFNPSGTFNPAGNITVNASNNNQQVNLSGLTLGNLANGKFNLITAAGNSITVNGSPVFNDAGAGNGAANILAAYGINSTVALTPTITSDTSGETRLVTAAGNFTNSTAYTGSTPFGFASDSYGINVANTGNFNGNKYGGYFSVSGTNNSANYGIKVNSVSGGSANFGIYLATVPAAATNYAFASDAAAQSYFLGNLGVGTSTPGSIFSIGNVANFTAATSTFYSTGGINLTSGCFAVNGTCLSSGGSTVTGTTGQFTYFSATNVQSATSTIFVTAASQVGIGTSSPNAALTVQGTGTGTNFLWNLLDGASATVASVLENGTAYFKGSFGIGTSTPQRKLDVVDPNANPQMRLSNSITQYAEFAVNSLGQLAVTIVGGMMTLPDSNLSVCAGGACPTTNASSTTGNLFVENAVVIGDGFTLKEINPTDIGLYDTNGGLMVTFDHGI